MNTRSLREANEQAGDVHCSFPPNWERWSSVVFLSPHSDDAAISVPFHMLCLTMAGKECCMVTCFSKSDFVLFGDSGDANITTELRKSEDARFTASLGPNCHPRWLDLPDAPLRGYPLQDLRKGHKFGGQEHSLIRQISRGLHLILKPGCTVFVPLGIGSHIDHRIVHEAGVSIANSGCHETVFYEEFPYVLQEDERKIRSRIAALETSLHGRLTPFSSRGNRVLEIRTAAASCYPSQVSAKRITEILAADTAHLRCSSERAWQFFRQKFKERKEDSPVPAGLKKGGLL